MAQATTQHELLEAYLRDQLRQQTRVDDLNVERAVGACGDLIRRGYDAGELYLDILNATREQHILTKDSSLYLPGRREVADYWRSKRVHATTLLKTLTERRETALGALRKHAGGKLAQWLVGLDSLEPQLVDLLRKYASVIGDEARARDQYLFDETLAETYATGKKVTTIHAYNLLVKLVDLTSRGSPAGTRRRALRFEETATLLNLLGLRLLQAESPSRRKKSVERGPNADKADKRVKDRRKRVIHGPFTREVVRRAYMKWNDTIRDVAASRKLIR